MKPSAIALGTVFNQTVETAGTFSPHPHLPSSPFTRLCPVHELTPPITRVVLSPLLGQTYQRAKASDTKEEFLRSREASSAAVTWSTSLVGSALQSYGVGALINATGTLSYKGAAYLGSLIFLATSALTVSSLSLSLPCLSSNR